VKALFETNLFGVMQMTNAVLPFFRRQSGGQIINLSSAAGLLTTPPFFGVYSASKHALEGYTEGLRYEVQPFNIRVSLVEPGYFKTAIVQTIETPDRPLEVYAARRQQAATLDRLSLQAGRDPICVAQTIAQIIRSRTPRLRLRGGTRCASGDHCQAPVALAVVEHYITWLFLDGAERRPVTSLTGLPAFSSTARGRCGVASNVVRSGSEAATTLIFGLWRKQK
jgi:hypothetical protein